MIWVEKTVDVDLGDLIDNDLEGVLDLLSEKVTGTIYVQDMSWKIVGHSDETTLQLRVMGWIDLDLADLDDDDLAAIKARVGADGVWEEQRHPD